MKKLLMIVMATAFVLSFLPKAEAGQTAQLGLTVVFDKPLTISSEPAGPFEVIETRNLQFTVRAADPDTAVVALTAANLPNGAKFTVIEPPPSDPVFRNYAVGLFEWTPETGQAQDAQYIVVFEATNSSGDKVQLEVKIQVLAARISIELRDVEGNPVSTWLLEVVRLGEKRSNMNAAGEPMHIIDNVGNVPVVVGIGYGPQIDPQLPILPALEPGKDRFATKAYTGDGWFSIPLNANLNVVHLKPSTKQALQLEYFAPTELSTSGVEGHGATYELRASVSAD